MSEILKAKKRILDRSKNQNPDSHGRVQHSEDFSLDHPHEQQFIQPKKFNISSISMKFQREEFEPQSRVRKVSPEVPKTERINSIRHFEPYRNSAMSVSNSQSSLRPKQKSKIVAKDKEMLFQMALEEESRNSYNEINYMQHHNESPIQRIRRTVHKTTPDLNIVKLLSARCQSPYKPRECVKEAVLKTIKSMKKDSKGFIDNEFPPHQSILFNKKSHLYAQRQRISFERLLKIYENQDKDVTLVKECEPTLIKEGSMTNPLVMNCLTILSEFPEKIINLLENQQINENGLYYVRLCKDGVWRYILVDDYVPVQDSKGYQKHQMLGIRTSEKLGIHQIWPSLVEKAMAKVYGTYEDLGKNLRQGIAPLYRLLTGSPVSKYDLIKDVRSYLVLIDSALKRNHVVVVEDILSDFLGFAESKGFSANESYRILEMEKKSFVLRNLTDPELETVLNFEEIMMFSSLLIFKQEDNYQYISQKLRHKKGYYSQVKVTVKKSTSCYWDIWQNNPAYYKGTLNSGVDYEVAPFKILIQPLTLYSVSQYDSRPEEIIIVESGKEMSMKAGEYMVSIHLSQKIERDFTLSYYGEQDIQIERVRNQELWSERCGIDRTFD